ncbi:MAG: ABC transporter permease, partial [Thermoplasmatota archaeon]
MSLLNIIKKEIKELLTPSTIIPVVVIALVFASMGNIMGGFMEDVEEKPVIGIINEDEGVYSEMAMFILQENAEIVYDGGDIDEAMDEVIKNDGAAVLRISPDFSDNIKNNTTGRIRVIWIMKGGGVMDSVPSEVVNSLLRGINTYISNSLIEETRG